MNYIAIYVKPSKEINKVIDSISKKFNKNIIKKNKLGYHITIIGSNFDPKVNTILKNIILKKRIKSINIETLDLKFFQKNLVLKVKSLELKKIHKEIIKTIQPYIVKKYSTRFDNYKSKDRLRIFNTYGNVFYEKYYNPHISIAKMDGLKSSDIKNIKIKRLRMNTREIYVSKITKKHGPWKDFKTITI